MQITIVLLATLILACLSFYAVKLVLKVIAQGRVRESNRKQRVDKISISIRTIAMALEQQQCNLSEGSIRLFHLLEGLPVVDKPVFSGLYPGLYSLYEQVKDLPTHEARKTLTKAQVKQQDINREELETKFESKILVEVAQLRYFSI
jgi:hypothetical protein